MTQLELELWYHFDDAEWRTSAMTCSRQLERFRKALDGIQGYRLFHYTAFYSDLHRRWSIKEQAVVK